jgi:hypothetical protein
MKKCTKCGEQKNLNEFPVNGKSKKTSLPIMRTQCKACVAERSRLWRVEHPGYAKAYMQEYIKTNYKQMVGRMKEKKQEIAEWKRSRGCTVCGETEPWVLDMHHLDPSSKETNSATSATLKAFLKEADKCILLCSNCHRKVHAGILTITDQIIQKTQRS